MRVSENQKVCKRKRPYSNLNDYSEKYLHVCMLRETTRNIIQKCHSLSYFERMCLL
jgi:hypothetical protein